MGLDELRTAAAAADTKVIACCEAVRVAEADLANARQMSREADRALIAAETRAAINSQEKTL